LGALGRAILVAIFTLALMSPVLGQPSRAAAQAKTVTFSTAAAAPADAVAYVVSTLDNHSDQWKLADQLLDRAGFGPAIDKMVAEDLHDEQGNPLPLDAFLGGEVAVVVSKTALDTLAKESTGGMDMDMQSMMEEMGLATPVTAPAGAKEQGFAVVLDARAPDTVWAALQSDAQDKSAQEVDYQGTKILYVAPGPDDEEGEAIARAGDLIFFSVTPGDLHEVIDTAAGRAPAITTIPEFTTSQQALPNDYLTFAFMNSQAVQKADFGPIMPAASELGTESYSALTIAADTPGFRMESVAVPTAGGTYPPGAANFDSELVNKAPANAVLFLSAADLGATGFLDALGASLIGLALGFANPMATPVPNASPEEEIAAQFRTAASLIGINLQTDLFQQLEGEYGFWLTADQNAQNASGLFASGTKNPETVANAVRQLSFLLQGAAGGETQLTTRKVDGGEVYVLELGDEAGSTLEFGVVNGQLVIGKGEAVDRFADSPSDNLAGNAQFQSVLGTLPADHNSLFYVDLTQAIPLAQAASKESSDFSVPGMTGMKDASESCANYASQEEAQAAYDAAEPGTFDLDQDFDGQVCEDYFVAAMATPEAAGGSSLQVPGDAFANVDYSAIKAFASVAYDENGLRRSSSILYIEQ
jgi:hypothetical protein